MFFGMGNSPATFQAMMDDVFHDMKMEGVMTYKQKGSLTACTHVWY